MGRWAYAAVAAAAVVEDTPSDWPDGWSFPGPPWPPGFVFASSSFENPSPADDVLAVALDANFSWEFAYTIDGVDYSADSFEIMIDDVVVGASSTASFDPGTLDVGDHTWRVIAYIGSTKYIGPEWSFQTICALSGEASAESGASGDLWDAAEFLSGEASAASDASGAAGYYGVPTYVTATVGTVAGCDASYPVATGGWATILNIDIGQYKASSDYYTYRTFCYVDVPDTYIESAKIKLSGTMWYSPPFTIYAKQLADFTPLTAADFAYSSIGDLGSAAAGATVEIDLDVGDLTPGTRLYFVLVSSGDVNGIAPVAPDGFDWLRYVHTIRLSLNGGA